MSLKNLVLVIEDDVSINDLLSEILIEEGYEIKSAFNGLEALQWLSQAVILPRLILLDLMMPVKNGYIFREEQLKISELARIPVVVMSADGNFIKNKSRIMADGYLKKPLELLELLDLVSKLINKVS